jgi:hypothetical protein
MTAQHIARSDRRLDIITHSPDGESRGLIFREGDIFPLDPTQHLLTGTYDEGTACRPWGLRFLSEPKPYLPTGKGKHEGPTSKTSGGTPDGSSPPTEETSSD